MMTTQTLMSSTLVTNTRTAPRTAAGQRAAQRRRARSSSTRRPPSGVLPSSTRTSAVVHADHDVRSAAQTCRMTRMARLLTTLTLLAAAVMLGVFALLPAPATVVGPVTVEQGDTLWSIASAAQPGADPRAVVDEIRRLNGMDGDSIPAGAVLMVPATGH